MKQKKANTLIYMIFFFVIFLAFCAFAIDGTIVLTNRVKLQNITEAAALAAVSDCVTGDILGTAVTVFNRLKKDRLEAATIQPPSVNFPKKQVLLSTEYISQPFFLSFLGVTGIKLEAKACAVSTALSAKSKYTGVSWVTQNATYLSDILSGASIIQSPIGGENVNSASYSYDTSGVLITNFSLIDSGGGPLSLGPIGYVTIRLPAPIVDKPGNDLYISEIGDSIEGYMVFAGLDANPDNPYSPDGSGGDIYWKNISCSGTAQELGSNPHATANTNLSEQEQAKFYGSGYFDLGATCITGNANEISMAKYIRIIDDNKEDAFIKSGGTYSKVYTYGEASTATAGADIDEVRVLNYVTLMSPKNFGK